MSSENQLPVKIHDFHQWYEQTYPELTGFGIWLRGGELNTLPEAEYDRRCCHVLLVRLSTYRDTADSYTHKLLYQLATSNDDIFADIAYLPPPKDIAIFERDHVPWMLGTSTKKPARDFDCLAISNAIMQELLNLPTMMQNSGIPLGKRQRLADPLIPVILLGGSNAVATSFLFTDDPLVDGIFIGEDVDCIRQIFSICNDSKKAGLSKSTLLECLRTVPGFFEPDKRQPTERFRSPRMSAAAQLLNAPILYEENQAGKASLQISDGCPYFCSFCFESWTHKPYREIDVDTLVHYARRMKAALGLHAIELSSFNFNIHSQIERLLWDLTAIFTDIKVKSQRFDQLRQKPWLMDILHAIGKTSLTLAIEGISARLRRYLQKNLSDQDIESGLRSIFRVPIRELKIFVIATGLEEYTDFQEFARLLDLLQQLVQNNRSHPRVIFSLTPLVRFPGTPLEFEPGMEIAVYNGIIEKISAAVQKNGFEFRLAATAHEAWVSQILVRSSDPRVLPACLKAITATSFVYYNNMPLRFVRQLRQALNENGLQSLDLLSCAAADSSLPQPWAHVQTGVSRTFLRQRYHALKADTEAASLCLPEKRPCAGCGACPAEPLTEMKEIQPKFNVPDPAKWHSRIKLQRQSVQPMRFLACISSRARGLSRKYAAAAVARALMLAASDLTPYYRGFISSLLGEKGDYLWTEGDDILSLAWDRESIDLLQQKLQQTGFTERVNHYLMPWGRMIGLVDDAPAYKISLSIQSPYTCQENRYLRSQHLTCTRRKSEPHVYIVELTRESLKKKIIERMIIHENSDGGATIDLVPGVKFNLTVFLKEAFKIPNAWDWVRIRVVTHLEFVALA